MTPDSHRRSLTLLTSALLLALTTAPAFAQDEPKGDELQPYRDLLAKAEAPEAKADAPAKTPANGLDPWSSFGLLFLGTALVCMGGYGVMRHQNPKLKRFDEDLHHLKTMKLGTNHQVSVVAIHGETYVLGLSQGNIQLLTKLDEAAPEAPAPKTPAAVPMRPRHAPTPRPKPARMQLADSSPSIPVVTAHSGLFEGFEDMDPGLFEEDEPVMSRVASAPPEPAPKARPRDESLESDSVLIALRAFKEQSERM